MSEQLIADVVEILKAVSLFKALLLLIVGITLIIGVTIFEHRGDSFARDPNLQHHFQLSGSSKAHVKSEVNLTTGIFAAIVLSVSPEHNQKLPVFWYSSDGQIQSVLDNALKGRTLVLPLLGADAKSNKSVVELLNGQFSCQPYDMMMHGGLFPGLQSRIPTVCQVSLPPAPGQFSGIILLGLPNVPTQSQVELVQVVSKRLSQMLYVRDVEE